MDTTVVTGDVKDVTYLRTPDDHCFPEAAKVVNWFVQDDQLEAKLRRVCIVLSDEEEGGFSAEVPHLPGVYSQGESEKEAVENIEEALHGVLESYRENDSTIPWSKEPVCISESQKVFWIILDVQAS